MRALVSDKILVDERWFSGAILHKQGKIVAVCARDEIPSDAVRDDISPPCVVLPGLVDSHVHINEPGRTEWEGFSTATQSAAAGGITTVVDMPLNCIPVTTSLAAFQTKMASLSGKLWVDAAFHGGVVPGNQSELAPMIAAGIRSFKAFMIDSGIPEFAWSSEAVLRQAMPVLRDGGATLLVHAELDNHNHAETHLTSYRSFLASRPAAMENRAIELVIALSKETGCPVHIVHLSSAEALPAIAAAQSQGIKITAETCPHYLCLAAEDIPDGDGRYKCMPPIRERANREALWQGLLTGTISSIVSDHSPCTPALKRLDSHNLRDAWGGISSLQFGLPLIWTEMKRRGISLEKIGTWMASNPARGVGLARRKGKIAPGYDADFVAFDREAAMMIEKSRIFHRHKETPYEGWTCRGAVRGTWLAGSKIFDGMLFLGEPAGRQL